MSGRPPLRFGVGIGGYSAGVSGGAEIADLARRAEAVGFDAVHVGDHIHIRFSESVDELPFTPTGKLQRHVLARRLAEQLPR
jgi:alkanesulfonate monooxygenase SsuD/methylene tetrahydromethanopterin reductase-like flavin-dependent oxidoreductase (luciferase family)